MKFLPLGFVLASPFIWWGLYWYEPRLGLGLSGVFMTVFMVGMMALIFILIDDRDRKRRAKLKYDEAVALRDALLQNLKPPTPAYDLLSPLEKERVDHEANEALYRVFNAIHNTTGWCGDLDPDCWKAGLPIITETMAKLIMRTR